MTGAAGRMKKHRPDVSTRAALAQVVFTERASPDQQAERVLRHLLGPQARLSLRQVQVRPEPRYRRAPVQQALSLSNYPPAPIALWRGLRRWATWWCSMSRRKAGKRLLLRQR
jgi:hypothetical protein